MHIRSVISRLIGVLSISLSAIFLTPLTVSASTPQPNIPDFAYPQTVLEASKESLKRDLESKDYAGVLSDALNMCVASSLRSPDRVEENISLLDSLSGVLPSPWRNLTLLIEADLYRGVYDDASWRYDRCVLPLNEPCPADMSAWSREMFAQKVLEKVSAATSDLMTHDKSFTAPLPDYGRILSVGEDTEAWVKRMSIGDYILLKGATILSGFQGGSSDNIIPFFPDSKRGSVSASEECNDLAERLCDSVIARNKKCGNSIVEAIAILERLRLPAHEKREAYLDSALDALRDKEGFAVLVSRAMPMANGVTERTHRLYALCSHWLSKFAGSPFCGDVQRLQQALSSRGVSVNIPDMVLPMKETEGRATLSNMNEAYMCFYPVGADMIDDYGNADPDKIELPAEPTAVAALKAEGEVPFSSEVCFMVPGLPAGFYVCIVSDKKHPLKEDQRKWNRYWHRVLNVSDITVMTVDGNTPGSVQKIYAVSASNQRPLEGAEVTLASDHERGVVKGLTDSNGCYRIKGDFDKITVSKGGSVVMTRVLSPTTRNSRAKINYDIFTDMSVYRPGGSVRFAVVAWLKDDKRCVLAPDRAFEVAMRDANGNVVSSMDLLTDASGRASGEFAVPTDGLLGRYTLEAYEKKGDTSGDMNVDAEVLGNHRQFFEVSDYKQPRFFVTVEREGTEDENSICFRGEAMTFSGMPLSGANIDYRVDFSPWWRWFPETSGATYGASMVADARGGFRIVLPVANLKGTPYERGNFQLRVSATSPDGETEESPVCMFSLGEAYMIEANIPSRIAVESDTVSLNVRVTDMGGFPVAKTVDYTLCDASGERVGKGSFTSPCLKLDARGLASGKYRFCLVLEGDTTETTAETVLYRVSDKHAPCVTPLWLPQQEIVAHAGDSTVNVVVGSGYKDSWIFYTVKHSDSSVQEGWIKIDDEKVSLSIKAPEGYERVEAVFSGMRDLDRETGKVTIVSDYSLRKLSAERKSFRERLTAGEKEKWQFRFSTGGSSAGTVYAMAVMTDKSLNSIAPFAWRFSPSLRPPFEGVRFVPLRRGSVYVNANFNGDAVDAPFVSYMLPEWQTYGYSLTGMRSYGGRLYATGVSMNESVRYKATSGHMADDAVALADMGVAEEASADLSEAESGGMAAEQELRPVELPVAFFLPSLQSTPDGELTVEFDVPNFNTTWQFQLMGYTDDLLSSVTTLDAVASKPVMAQGNMPLFLRTGDKARLRALLFNNSDRRLCIGGRIEVVNPLSGAVLEDVTFAGEDVEPSESRMVGFGFDVPYDVSQIEVRVYATSDDFSDGESIVIPVYPSSSPVVESTQFYMGRNEKEISLQIPVLNDEANVTLRYCSDPIRECLLALPALSVPDSRTSLALSQSLYANSVAARITELFPEVRKSLESLFQTDAYKDLRSSLEKDVSLKITGLKQTPWVNNARNERERMLRLGSLLDSVQTREVTEGLCMSLGELQNADGGWSWCEGMRSSLFITREILREFGEMKRADAFPTSADEMTDNAFRFCDNEILSDYEKHGEVLTVQMLEYLYAKSLFATYPAESDEFVSLRKKALDQIYSDWKKLDVCEKAEAALVLFRSPGYSDVSLEIMRSLEEFATEEEQGVRFKSVKAGFGGVERLLTTSMVLNAYAEIMPDSGLTDGLRQWLLLQKETEDWGSRALTVQVVQSILSSGTKWGVEPDSVRIYLEDREIVHPGTEPDGMLGITLHASDVSGKELRIRREGPEPMWGGVVSQYIAPMNEVQVVECENLKVTKQLVRVTETASGIKGENAPLNVGDKVRVTLTVVCDKDMDYVALVDERAACLQPEEWLSGYGRCGDVGCYRETRDNRTSFFIEFLPQGTHVITYDCRVDRAGVYSSGIATVQSQYAPQNVAHSGGSFLMVGASD